MWVAAIGSHWSESENSKSSMRNAYATIHFSDIAQWKGSHIIWDKTERRNETWWKPSSRLWRRLGFQRPCVTKFEILSLTENYWEYCKLAFFNISPTSNIGIRSNLYQDYFINNAIRSWINRSRNRWHVSDMGYVKQNFRPPWQILRY